ncbi:MAG: AraC family transcriptional regulator [Bacteroidales bacterium]|nr:AraC family transcriptional regulator [Bacteroidales bacterium]
MEDNLQTINLKQIRSLEPVVDEYGIGDDFILGEASGERVQQNETLLKMLRYPIRFDGYIIFFLKKGHLRADVNLNTYDIEEHSLLISVPGNIIRVADYREERVKDIELTFVLISREFMSGIRIDFLKVLQDSMKLLDNPCIHLDDFQIGIADDYFKLARKIISSPLSKKREIIGSLLTSLTYMSADILARRIDDARKMGKEKNSARLNLVFEQFIALVNEYHNSERGMAFYAEKMCLTPKYLSKLIKQASGRSAPEWIDSFVILEAKNMLKYSGMTIKEIVYKLHFPNQSVFYKFFKAHTGMTPSEYRNG